MRAALGVVLLGLVLVACAPAVQVSPGALPQDGGAGSAAAPDDLAKREATRPGAATTGEGAGPRGPVAMSRPAPALIVKASVALRASDPWAASDRSQAIAATVGGSVASLSQSGSGDQRRAALTLRVPVDRIDDVLRQLRGQPDIEVLSSSVESQDVAEQLVDLEARLKVKQAEEQRYLALLARAERIEDILRIDQALAPVRTQIEQLTAQLNNMRGRVAFATIGVNITPLLATTPGAPSVYDPARTLERALAALTLAMRTLLDAAIWLMVFGWLPLILFAAALAARRFWRLPTAKSA